MPSSVQPAILVVDDSDVVCAFVSKHLSKLGCRCVVAKNGKVALDLFRKESFRLVLMDLYMPVLDGLKATAAIRELEEQEARDPVAILAMSSLDANDLHVHGFDGYLAKPVNSEDLRELISNWIGTGTPAAHT